MLSLEENYSDIRCEVCDSDNNEDKMLLCDDCDCGYHTFCVGLNRIPNTDRWYCHYCIKNKDPRVQYLQKIEMISAKQSFLHMQLRRSERNRKEMNRVRRSLRLNNIEFNIFT